MSARLPDPVLERFRQEMLPALVAAVAPQKVIAFGSRARGDALADSDLDLVIVAESFRGVPWIERAVDVLRILGAADFGIELLCYTPEEYARKVQELGIVRTAAEEGVELVG